jgi:hypothetical protein
VLEDYEFGRPGFSFQMIPDIGLCSGYTLYRNDLKLLCEDGDFVFHM